MITIFPKPKKIVETGDSFKIGEVSSLYIDEKLSGCKQLLASRFSLYTALTPTTDSNTATISIGIDEIKSEKCKNEGYTLKIDENGIRITVTHIQGAFNAIATLFQLLPNDFFRHYKTLKYLEFPCVSIEDYPYYEHRGALLDVARHFMPVSDILRFIDTISLFKFNVLHFHLTEDQGWRIEIKKYPKLTQIGAYRHRSEVGSADRAVIYNNRPHGGFYTQEDIKEIVQYARDRGVKVMPEIDIPGHCQAVLASYPEFGIDYADVKAGNRIEYVNESGEKISVDKIEDLPEIKVWDTWGVSEQILNVEEYTLNFLEDVFDEICALFDSDIIMLGGDECPYTKWEKSPRVNERMKELGITSYKKMQSYFIDRIANFLSKRNRRVMCWDEVVETSPLKSTIIACWQNESRAAVAKENGYSIVNMPVPRSYLDMRQSDSNDEPIPRGEPLTFSHILGFDISGTETDAVLGSEVALWSEHFDTVRRFEDAAFPRAIAMGERLWSGHIYSDNEIENFEKEIKETFSMLDALGVNYRRIPNVIPIDLLRPDAP